MGRRRSSRVLASQAMDLSIAVPQVIAHRMLRMALAGHSPTARDRREFQRMGTEKMWAFYESWNAMFLQMALSWHQGPMAVLATGMAPIRRRAVANARRLGRRR